MGSLCVGAGTWHGAALPARGNGMLEGLSECRAAIVVKDAVSSRPAVVLLCLKNRTFVGNSSGRWCWALQAEVGSLSTTGRKWGRRNTLAFNKGSFLMLLLQQVTLSLPQSLPVHGDTASLESQLKCSD